MKIPQDTLEDFLNTMPAVLYEYVLYLDGRGEFLFMSPTAREILGYPPEYFMEDVDRFYAMVHPDDLAGLLAENEQSNAENVFFVSEVRCLLPSGEERWIRLSSKPTAKRRAGAVVWSGYIIDITAQKQAEAEVKLLKGILPFCSYCKKIRDDDGYWERVDLYIASHMGAEISHGICPECAEEHFPAYVAKMRAERGE